MSHSLCSSHQGWWSPLLPLLLPRLPQEVCPLCWQYEWFISIFPLYRWKHFRSISGIISTLQTTQYPLLIMQLAKKPFKQLEEVYTCLQVPKSSKVEVTLDQGCATVWQTLVPTLLQHTWFTIRWNRKCKTIQSTPFYCNAAIWIQRSLLRKWIKECMFLGNWTLSVYKKRYWELFILPLLRVSWVFPFYVGTHHSLLGTRIVCRP